MNDDVRCHPAWNVRAGGRGGQHVRHEGAPLTNRFMTLLAVSGIPVEQIGDSTGKLAPL